MQNMQCKLFDLPICFLLMYKSEEFIENLICIIVCTSNLGDIGHKVPCLKVPANEVPGQKVTKIAT